MISGGKAGVASADDGDICSAAAFKGRVGDNVFGQGLEPPAFLPVIGHIIFQCSRDCSGYKIKAVVPMVRHKRSAPGSFLLQAGFR